MSGLKMFECLGDCADFDLVNGCVANDTAVATGASSQQQERGQPQGEGAEAEYSDGEASEDGSQQSYSDEDEGSYYSQDEEEKEDNSATGQRTGEYDADGAYIPAPSSGSKRAPPLYAPSAGTLGNSQPIGNPGPPPPYNGGGSGADLQALSVKAALRAREQNNGGGGGGGGGGGEAGGGGDSTYSSESSAAASVAAQEAAEAGRRASSSAKDAVAAAAAAADAKTQEEAEAAADRAAKAAANAAAGAAGAARAASAAGRAAAAEQAARNAVDMAAGVKTGRTTRRSASVPAEGDDDTDGEAYGNGANPDAVGGAVDQSLFRSTPGASEMMAAPTPGRESEGERTWIMARRVAANWENEELGSKSKSIGGGDGVSPEAEQPSPSAQRTFVSTRLRHLRLSPDGTTLVVKSDKGGVDHELALDELLEVHETPSEESVTLMGRDIEIRIAFKGQAKALKQFRNMLVPAGNSGTVNTTTGGEDGSAPTTVTTIKDVGEDTRDTGFPATGVEGASSAPGATAEMAETAPAESYEGQARETDPSANGGENGSLAAAPGSSFGTASTGFDQAQQQPGLEGIDEGSSYSREVPLSSAPVPGNMASNPSSGYPSSAGSSVSGWGSVQPTGSANVAGGSSATQRQLASLTERSSEAQAKAQARARSGLIKDKDGGSSIGGSTFADAKERELVIAALQDAEQTMSPVEREAKLHLVKYEQAGFVRGYEALCDQQQVRLRKRPEFSELESVGVKEGLADPSIVLRQPNKSTSVDVHYADAVRAKTALDAVLDSLVEGTQGLWVRAVPIKAKDSIKRKATNDYGGDVRRVLDMARTSVICETPELVRQFTDKLKACEGIGKIGRMKNGFGSTAVGRGGYRDIKVNLMPTVIEHYVEVQVHLREFYELNSRSHEVYEWARGVDLPDGTTPHLLFRNLTPDVQAEMTQLVKDDWMGLRRILPELLQATEQFNEAEPLLRQNVTDAEKRWEMAKERFGEGHLHEMSCAQGVAMALNNLALALKGRGDVQGAEPLLRRALQMSIDSQGAEHPEVATRLNSLALLLASDGRVVEAEGLHRQALEIAGKVYGPEHADVATYLNNLARVLKAQDKYAEAEPLQRSALAIGERMLGTNHSDVATYYNNLSRLVRAQKRLEEAEPLQRRAVEIGERVLGPNSPDLATWVNNLGRLLMARKKLVEAEKVQERAVTIAENVFGPHHAQVARARKNLTKVRWALGKKAGSSR